MRQCLHKVIYLHSSSKPKRMTTTVFAIGQIIIANRKSQLSTFNAYVRESNRVL